MAKTIYFFIKGQLLLLFEETTTTSLSAVASTTIKVNSTHGFYFGEHYFFGR